MTGCLVQHKKALSNKKKVTKKGKQEEPNVFILGASVKAVIMPIRYRRAIKFPFSDALKLGKRPLTL